VGRLSSNWNAFHISALGIPVTRWCCYLVGIFGNSKPAVASVRDPTSFIEQLQPGEIWGFHGGEDSCLCIITTLVKCDRTIGHKSGNRILRQAYTKIIIHRTRQQQHKKWGYDDCWVIKIHTNGKFTPIRITTLCYYKCVIFFSVFIYLDGKGDQKSSSEFLLMLRVAP